jgi:hypothetical protein
MNPKWAFYPFFLMCTSYYPSSYPARFKRSKLSNFRNFHYYKKWTKPIYFDVDILRQLLDPSGHPQCAKSHPSKTTSLYFFIPTMPYHRPLNRTCPMHPLLTHVQGYNTSSVKFIDFSVILYAKIFCIVFVTCFMCYFDIVVHWTVSLDLCTN